MKASTGAGSPRVTLIVAAVAIAGCARALPARSGDHCNPPTLPRYVVAPDPAPPPGASRQERLAALLGIRAALADRGASRPLSMEQRVMVLERLELARLSVSATTAELDCEGERAGQAASYLARQASGTVQGLTVASIAAAAATGIASVLLSTNNAGAATQDVVGVSGGLVTAGLGLGSLAVHPHVDYGHSRNLLADIWSPPRESLMYPPVVWAYLTEREYSNAQQQSIREKIVARWRSYEAPGREDEALLFGRGGRYDADLLETRSRMLNQVKAEVDLANQELERLASDLTR